MSKVRGIQMTGSPVEIGEPVLSVSIAGAPGLPAMDGRRLTNVLSKDALGIFGQYQSGPLLSYSQSGASVSGEIQYVPVFLLEGTTIVGMRCYRAHGGSVARFVNMGLYSSVDPEDISTAPYQRLRETGSLVTTGTGSYISAAFASPYTTPVAGLYWLAFVADTATPLRFQMTEGPYPSGFLPVWRESGSMSTLPALAGTLSQPASSVIFVAALE